MAYEIADTVVITDASNGVFQFAVAKRIANSTRAFVQHLSGISMFPFASYGSSSDLLSSFPTVQARAGSSSSTHGYVSGGGLVQPGAGATNAIDRFPFTTQTPTLASVGSLSGTRVYGAGQSSSTHGYTSGGDEVASPTVTPFIATIERFPFVASTNSSSVGNLTLGRWGPAGLSSPDFGYSAGGSFPISNVIDRFPFASATVNAADVGDLTITTNLAAGMQSYYDGFVATGAPTSFNINRFPFASATVNATSSGDFLVGRFAAAGVSSVTDGYIAGGRTSLILFVTTNTIEKFTFSSTDNSAIDIGNLTGNYAYGEGLSY